MMDYLKTARGVVTTACLLSLILLLAGCDALGFGAYALFGSNKKTIKAQYTGLEGCKTAVVITGRPGIDFEYPQARANIALALNRQLQANVKQITLLTFETVEQTRRSIPDWNGLTMQQIGQRLGVERLLMIDLIHFTTTEAGSVNLLRGLLVADARVHEIDHTDPESSVYQAELEVVFPEGAPRIYTIQEERGVAFRTIAKFAVELSRKFYDHEADID